VYGADDIVNGRVPPRSSHLFPFLPSKSPCPPSRHLLIHLFSGVRVCALGVGPSALQRPARNFFLRSSESKKLRKKNNNVRRPVLPDLFFSLLSLFSCLLSKKASGEIKRKLRGSIGSTFRVRER
jgi:hypothetical protein